MSAKSFVPLEVIGLPTAKKREILSAEQAEKTYATQLNDVLHKIFGHERFRPGQKEVMLAICGNRDAFVLMPTGGGKSLCYQLPSLVLNGVTIVVSPLIALMQDQVFAAQKKGIKANFINSTQSKKARETVLMDLQSKTPTTKLIYVTPELIATNTFMKVLKSLHSRNLLAFFAIDEAHCISQWGHDFRPKYRGLSVFKKEFPGVPVMAVTATATPKVREDILKCVGLSSPFVSRGSFDRPNIRYEVRYKDLINAPYSNVKSCILSQPDGKNSPGIIYCQKKETCEELAEKLKLDGFKAAPYHAEKSQKESTLKQWINGDILIIVGTIAVGMGIDKEDVRFVIHYQIPKSLESLYQESGRAGRDGKPSRSVVYYSSDDKSLMQFLITKEGETKNSEAALLAFQKLCEFCVSASCRRKKLLDYFGDKQVTCNNCDFCQNPQSVRQNIQMLHGLNSNLTKSWNHITTTTGPVFQKKRKKAEEEETSSEEDAVEASEESMDVEDGPPVKIKSGASENDIWKALEKAERDEQRTNKKQELPKWTSAKSLLQNKKPKTLGRF